MKSKQLDKQLNKSLNQEINIRILNKNRDIYPNKEVQFSTEWMSVKRKINKNQN